MTGPELETLCTELNGGAPIGSTLLFQLLNLAKGLVEQRRPWMLLRSTDTSASVPAGSTWASVSLAGIARFNRFYGDTPVKLYDGNNGITPYRQRPIEDRLYARMQPNTFCFDESTKTIYLNGTVPYAGTLWVDHIKFTPDLTSDDGSTWAFPSYAPPLLGFMAVAINKGGIDYDDIFARMAPDNRAVAETIMSALENWDNEKQLAAIATSDPYQQGGDFRAGAINL